MRSRLAPARPWRRLRPALPALLSGCLLLLATALLPQPSAVGASRAGDGLPRLLPPPAFLSPADEAVFRALVAADLRAVQPMGDGYGVQDLAQGLWYAFDAAGVRVQAADDAWEWTLTATSLGRGGTHAPLAAVAPTSDGQTVR